MCISSWANTLIIPSSERKPARKIVPKVITCGRLRYTDALSRDSMSGRTRLTEFTRAIAWLMRTLKLRRFMKAVIS